LLGIVCAVSAKLYYDHRVETEIRDRLQEKIAGHYAGLSVSIDSARLVKGQGIEIRGLAIAAPNVEGPAAELARVEEIFLRCRTGARDLLLNELDVRHVALRRMTLRADRRGDGSWSIARLWPLPKLSEQPHAALRVSPPITIEDGTIEIIDHGPNGVATMVFRQIDLELTPQGETPPPGTAPPIQFHGSLAGDHVRQIEVKGFVNPNDGTWSVRGNAQNVVIAPELWRSLPNDLAEPAAPLRPLTGRADLAFSLVSDPAKATPLKFAVSGQLTDGTIDDPQLPYPLTGVTASVRCDNQSVQIERLTAQSGQTTLELDLSAAGYTAESPLTLHARARQLQLDHRLADSLPESMQSIWQQYSPAGVVDADLTLQFDGQRWRPDLTMQCLDVSFSYYKTPYRIDRVVGTVHWKDDVLHADLRGNASGSAVRIDGRIANPGPQYTGFVNIRSESPIPVDKKLLAALDEPSRNLVRSFHPRGAINVAGRVERDDPKSPAPHKHWLIQLHDCSIEYDHFRYPIERIRGTLEMKDRHWWFRDLSGRNDSGHIACSGRWVPAEPTGGSLTLDISASDVALEDELRHALTPEMQRIWTSLRPRGNLDHLAVALAYDSREKKVCLDVRAQKWPKSQNVEGRSISIEPVWFPYRMDQLTGTVRYRDGQIEMQDLAAVHDRVQLQAQGRCEVFGEDAWQVRLDRFTAGRFRDSDRGALIAALPPKLAGTVEKLNLSGPISVGGFLQLDGIKKPDGEEQTLTKWDVDFDVENGSLGCGIQLDHLHGGVRLIGRSQGERYESRGELALDSAIYKGYQFTQIRGPLWIDPTRVVFGAWAEQIQGVKAPRQLTANLLGGKVQGDGHVELNDKGAFALQANLAGADLSQLAGQTTSGQHKITGKAYASIELVGACSGTHTLRGAGNIRLREADIYELPVMVALLKTLSFRRPDKTAFTASDIGYRIEGDHMYLNPINFNGDAISLKGRGAISLDRKIDKMEFYTIVGSDKRQIPILGTVLGEASRQILVVRVAGTLDNPQTTREAFPALNETLQQLFPEEARIERQDLDRLLEPPRDVLERTGLLPRR